MAKQNQNKEGPSCACGKVDLYEEWLKNENSKKIPSDDATSKNSEDNDNPANSKGKEN